MPIAPYIRNLRKHIGHELLMLPGASVVVVNEAGEILLLRRADTGDWSVPAGAIDPGEQPADAAIREAYEEAGVKIELDRLAGVALHPVTYPNGDQCQYLNVWFRGRPVGGSPRPLDGEALEVRWFPPDALPEINPFVRLRIDSVLNGDDRAWYARPGETHEAITSLDGF